jgi:superfamily II DNA or RNA helicase
MATPLKSFQDTAYKNAVELLDATHDQLSKLHDERSRDIIVRHNGCLLIEAPTGAGKTLIAGHTAQQFSKGKKIIWFWFAPFSGLIEQSINTIKQEFPGLTVRDPRKDRTINGMQSGDIYVTTWQSVAANNTESRKTRTKSDSALSLDALVPAVKSLGYHVGVIVDEAHHGFKKAPEALSFYQNVLSPDFTIMVTATPKDKDIDTFKQSTGIAEVHKISISRMDCVDADLIKKGVKAIAFLVNDESRAITDFEKTALRSGLEKHHEIEAELEASGFDLKPLMLVQVDSANKDSVEDARRKLIELGMNASQIAIHTADDPDPNLLALAQDEHVHVLIFKVAVALGFDCPRAFTLVSMRRSRDADFGVQVVGRILRVHRLLQCKERPDLLKYGYVVLADYGIQEGLTKAADRLKSIETQLASASKDVGLVVVNGVDVQAQEMRGGQASFWTTPPRPEPVAGWPATHEPSSPQRPAGTPQQITFFDGEIIPPRDTLFAAQPLSQNIQIAGRAYSLRDDLVFPKVLKKEICNADWLEGLAQCITAQINLDGGIMNAAYRRFASATKRTTELFDGVVETEAANADINMKQIAMKAQRTLFGDENISGRTLHDLLIRRLREEFQQKGLIGGASQQELEDALNLILATYPNVLREAKRRCYANFIEAADAAPLPNFLTYDEPLEPARLNLYGVMPPGLTSDEREFALMLDNDTSGDILWWHRNPQSKPYTSSLVMPELRYDYNPDYAVGVRGRKSDDSILMIEVKGTPYLDTPETVVKARAVHKAYKKVAMFHWQDRKTWRLVTNDDKTERNYLDQVYRPSLLATF